MNTGTFSADKRKRSVRFGLVSFAAMTVLACTPATRDVAMQQPFSGTLHYTQAAATTYSRTPPGIQTYSSDIGEYVGSTLGEAARDNSAVQRLAETVPEPQSDPAGQLAQSVFRSLAARPSITPGQTQRLGSGSAPATLAAQARAGGLSGALLDVSEARLNMFGSGAATQIGGNRVVVVFSSTVSLIDISSGEVLARSRCREDSRTRRADVEVNTSGFATREAEALVQTCAAEFLGQVR